MIAVPTVRNTWKIQVMTRQLDTKTLRKSINPLRATESWRNLYLMQNILMKNWQNGQNWVSMTNWRCFDKRMTDSDHRLRCIFTHTSFLCQRQGSKYEPSEHCITIHNQLSPVKRCLQHTIEIHGNNWLIHLRLMMSVQIQTYCNVPFPI